MQVSGLGPLAGMSGINHKTVSGGGPRPKYQPCGYKEKAPPPLLYMHTEPRPHAAPKGQEETLIGREDPLE